MTEQLPPPDRVDLIMRQVAKVSTVPDLTLKELCQRLQRAGRHVELLMRRELAAFDIEPWELELLACLRRAGPPHTVTAGVLQDAMRLTSGAVTKRVAALERRGWLRREIDLSDRRQVLVVLTEEGERRALEVFGVRSEAEARMFRELDQAVIRRLNADLRTLLLAFEGPVPDDAEVAKG